MMSISINELERTKVGPVWVLNKSEGKHKGDIIFVCSKINGAGTDTIKVPLTYLPINLTEQVTRKQLLESSEFRRSIMINLVVVISEEDANSLLSMPGAREEKTRLLRESQMIDSALHETSVGMLSGGGEGDDNAPNDNAVDTQGKIDGVLASVVMLAENMESKNQIEIANSLRTMDSELSKEDYEYIRNRAIDLKYKKLAKFCRQCIENF